MGQKTGGSVEDRVRSAVEAWLRWLPRWRPASHRSPARICRRCFGSPIAAAAGFGPDVPHAVQHALVMRIDDLIDDAVQEYTDRNLPLLARELQDAEARKAARGYRPADGLEPEYRGLDLDPEPSPGQPFLFTIAELERASAADHPVPEPEPLSAEAKRALQHEVHLADDFADQVGMSACVALSEHRSRISDAIARLVEPQIEALLEELSRSLDAPQP